MSRTTALLLLAAPAAAAKPLAARAAEAFRAGIADASLHAPLARPAVVTAGMTRICVAGFQH